MRCHALFCPAQSGVCFRFFTVGRQIEKNRVCGSFFDARKTGPSIACGPSKSPPCRIVFARPVDRTALHFFSIAARRAASCLPVNRVHLSVLRYCAALRLYFTAR